MGTWEHRAILEGNKGTRTPPWETLNHFHFSLLQYADSLPLDPSATDFNPSCISKDMIVSIAPQKHHHVVFSKKNAVNHPTSERTDHKH